MRSGTKLRGAARRVCVSDWLRVVPPRVLWYTAAEELHRITVDPDRPADGCTGQFELHVRGDCRLIRHTDPRDRVSAPVCVVSGPRDARRIRVPTIRSPSRPSSDEVGQVQEGRCVNEKI